MTDHPENAPPSDASHAQPEKMSFMDSQFTKMSGCGFFLIILCVPFLALLLGLVGLIACKHPTARERATTMTIFAAIWFVISLVILFAQVSSVPS